MVTTRSADKRLDASKEEDLVLRSRRIESPRSTASTPSQVPKRNAASAEHLGSPRNKRSRPNADDAAVNGGFRVVVNVPVTSTGTSSSQHIQDESNEIASVNESIKSLPVARTTQANKAQVPTAPARATSPGTPLRYPNETFRTPATSRHRRFDTEDSDHGDDTIMVSAGVDSAPAQGYQTAEEEIEDSDDEAPEVQTTKAAALLPRGRVGRTRKAKKEPQPMASIIDEDADTVEVSLAQIGTSPLSRGPAIDSADPQNADFDEKQVIPSESEASSALVARSQTISTTRSITDDGLGTETPLHRTIAPPETASASHTALETMDFSTMSSSLPETPKREILPPNPHVSLVNYNNWQAGEESHIMRAYRKRTRHSELFPTTSSAIRLPSRSISSVSSFRKDKLQQKVAGSAGAVRMQADWSKKRRSFVVP